MKSLYSIWGRWSQSSQSSQSSQWSQWSQWSRLGRLSVLVLIPFWMSSCKEDVTAVYLTPIALETPVGFPEMEVPVDNQPFAERIALGEMLFYDTRLSNSGISCSTCHIKENGYTSSDNNPGMPVLPHQNMAWKNTFMWDGSKSGTLEDVMQFEVEEFFQTDLSVFNADPEYVTLFEQAYGPGRITSVMMAKALAQFERTLVFANSKYDKVMRGEATFTVDEQAGFEIFTSELGSCYHCHTPPLFYDDGLHNTGLNDDYSNPDQRGYFNITNDSADLGRMRTATLRNVALRPRYMHDGRFTTLRQVVEHYNNGVHRTNSLDPTMIKRDGTVELHLSNVQIDQLVSFLETLTEE